jgi:hypothetical protein
MRSLVIYCLNKSRTERRVGNVERMDEIRNVNKILVGIPEQNELSDILMGSAKESGESLWTA